MDFRTRTAKERAAHYEQEADKFRRMAEAEPVEHIRQELLAVAEQYRKLADSLDHRQRLKSPKPNRSQRRRLPLYRQVVLSTGHGRAGPLPALLGAPSPRRSRPPSTNCRTRIMR